MRRTKEDFESEIADARAALEAQGRVIGGATLGPSDESSLKSEYELPYSSLPKIRSKKWLQSDKFVS